jgi:hypothetical protein
MVCESESARLGCRARSRPICTFWLPKCSLPAHRGTQMQPCTRGIVVWLGAIASVIGSNTANGQPGCPAITFLNAGTVDMRPSASSHLAILRQNDGSYTSYEIADASPYHVIATTPHVERQFAACVPHILPTTRVPNPVIATNALGVASQTLATAVLSSGRYVIASVFLTDPPFKSESQWMFWTEISV